MEHCEHGARPCARLRGAQWKLKLLTSACVLQPTGSGPCRDGGTSITQQCSAVACSCQSCVGVQAVAGGMGIPLLHLNSAGPHCPAGKQERWGLCGRNSAGDVGSKKPWSDFLWPLTALVLCRSPAMHSAPAVPCGSSGSAGSRQSGSAGGVLCWFVSALLQVYLLCFLGVICVSSYGRGC